MERRVDELLRLVLHQLEPTNSIDAARSVKTMNTETASQRQLLAIHYSFARGLQEKAEFLVPRLAIEIRAARPQHISEKPRAFRGGPGKFPEALP